MDDTRIQEKTGKSLKEWIDLLKDRGAADWPHKRIADFLHEQKQLEYWWAQTLTVEYEKHIGRRVEGQTADGSFQLGVRKTLPLSPDKLWDRISGDGKLWADDNGPAKRSGFTTLKEGGREPGHFRMPWTLKDWPRPSILQVRVLQAKDPNKAVLSIHQEKLPNLQARESLQIHWKGILSWIKEDLTES